jgi:hypothetical protein
VSDAVFLKSTQVLSDLHTALKTYDGNVVRAIEGVDREIAETRAWLTERRTHWLREVEVAEQELQRAESALAACEASGYYDDEGNYCEPDCSSEETEVAAATERVNFAQAGLAKVETWASNCEQAISEFACQRQRFTSVVLERIPRACSFLERKVGEYSEAIGVVMGHAPLATLNAAHVGESNAVRAVAGNSPAPLPGKSAESASASREKRDGIPGHARKLTELIVNPKQIPNAAHLEGQDAIRLAQTTEMTGDISQDLVTADQVVALRDALKKVDALKPSDVIREVKGSTALPSEFITKVIEDYLNMVPRDIANNLPKLAITVTEPDVIWKGMQYGPKWDGKYDYGGNVLLGSHLNQDAARLTLFHELTHWVHIEGPGWYRDAIQAHFAERTAGEDVAHLAGYRDETVGKRDDWYKSYAGKVLPGEEAAPSGIELAPTYIETLALPDEQLAGLLSDPQFCETLDVTLSVFAES